MIHRFSFFHIFLQCMKTIRSFLCCRNRLVVCIFNICKDVLGRLPKVVGVDIVEMALWAKVRKFLLLLLFLCCKICSFLYLCLNTCTVCLCWHLISFHMHLLVILYSSSFLLLSLLYLVWSLISVTDMCLIYELYEKVTKYVSRHI